MNVRCLQQLVNQLVLLLIVAADSTTATLGSANEQMLQQRPRRCS
jgi:hypothetical protein